MNKILSGVLGLVAVLGVTAGSAYALFSDSVEINGIDLETGTANLEIKFTGGPSFLSAVTVPTSPLATLSPGEQSAATLFDLNNASSDGLDMNITGFISGHEVGPDWDDLKSLLELSVYLPGENPELLVNSTGFVPLSSWESFSQTLPGGTLLDTDLPRSYEMRFRLSSSATSTVQGRLLEDLVVTFVGTQTP